MRKRILAALLISIIPLNAVRVFLFRRLLGYRIGRATRIGWLTLLAVDAVEIGDGVVIGGLNLVKGPFTFRIGNRCWIGRQNTINASWSIAQDRFSERAYGRLFELGDECVIQHSHYFDVYGRFIVGAGSWIVGRGSQFWTHGLSVEDRDIRIGEGNCITSAVRFAPGAGLGHRNIVSIGSVLLSKVLVDDHVISGFPAKAIRSIAEDRAAGKYHFSKADW